MIFNSIAFIVFFVIAVLLYYCLPLRFRWLWIVATGIFFYCYANPTFIIVPLFIAMVTYFAGLKMQNAATEKKANLIYLLAIITNIGLLVFFKYTNFFTNTFVDVFNIFSSSDKKISNSFLLNIAAPLGISYITFQAIGYLIEVKKGNHQAEKHLGHFTAYLLFFPKIIAGPVERAHNFLPQLKTIKPLQYDDISIGCKQFIWGLFKKLVVADRLSIYVDAVYNNYEHHSGITLFVTAVFYLFQMYADFSGYTDMALGLARIMGFNLTQNFNRPLFAKSVTEFWRKWHISLSTWFADYFYNPIAINKRDWGKWSIVYASFTTFIVLGFWHGANWTFIVFGAMQGFLLTIEYFSRKFRKDLRKKIPAWLNNISGILFTCGYFALSLVFFRANSVTDALQIIKRIVHFNGPFFTDNLSSLLFCILGIGFIYLVEFKKEFYNNLFTISNNKNWLVRNAYHCLLLMIILLAGVFDGGQFIYFQF
jgi:D-alanyl-lipoteichoic acid acyltransferase DltB (MBOAT superfamily)